MTKIIFICEGNICRSPTAEFVFKYLLKADGMDKDFDVSSRATITQTKGEDIYQLAKDEMDTHHIPYESRLASPITIDEYNKADYVIGMDNYNIVLLKRLIFIRTVSKLHLLLDFSSDSREIFDPYYTRDFKKAFDDIYLGCQGLLDYFKKRL